MIKNSGASGSIKIGRSESASLSQNHQGWVQFRIIFLHYLQKLFISGEIDEIKAEKNTTSVTWKFVRGRFGGSFAVPEEYSCNKAILTLIH